MPTIIRCGGGGIPESSLYSLFTDSTKFKLKYVQTSAHYPTAMTIAAGEEGLVVTVCTGEGVNIERLNKSGTVVYTSLAYYFADGDDNRDARVRVVAYKGGNSGGSLQIGSTYSWGAVTLRFSNK